jgi:beta-N-acetylglucosaminidase
MKRLLIINIILILLIYIIPSKNIEITKEEIIQITETIKITNRGMEQKRNIKNLNIDVNSDLRILSNLTADEYNKMLENTELNGLGNALEKAEKEYEVNGLYLMGLACLESGYGKSEFARKRNNLVGWNAVNSNPNKASYFESKEECILYVAERLKTNYLNENGCYFNGYSARAIDVKYCTDKKHADKIIQIINKLKVRL